MNQVRCPQCKDPVWVPEARIGCRVQCPWCQIEFVASLDKPAPQPFPRDLDGVISIGAGLIGLSVLGLGIAAGVLPTWAPGLAAKVPQGPRLIYAISADFFGIVLCTVGLAYGFVGSIRKKMRDRLCLIGFFLNLPAFVLLLLLLLLLKSL